jgi:hypothetical protein
MCERVPADRFEPVNPGVFQGCNVGRKIPYQTSYDKLLKAPGDKGNSVRETKSEPASGRYCRNKTINSAKNPRSEISAANTLARE